MCDDFNHLQTSHHIDITNDITPILSKKYGFSFLVLSI